jgi:hypothetical protein
MNRKLAERMTNIQFVLIKSNQHLPIAERREEIKPIYCGNVKGVRVHGLNVWGISPREYWKYCKCVN